MGSSRTCLSADVCVWCLDVEWAAYIHSISRVISSGLRIPTLPTGNIEVQTAASYFRGRIVKLLAWAALSKKVDVVDSSSLNKNALNLTLGVY